MTIPRHSRFQITALAVCVVLSSFGPSAFAADPAFVGKLAFAIDDDGVKRLGLSDEVKRKLLDLINRRENEAVDFALKLKDLPPPERARQLAPFVAESERQGMALLTVQQRAVLDKMSVARQGMNSLMRPEIGRVLGLNEEQRTQITALVAERNAALGKGGEDERRATMQEYERRLAEVLTEQQRTNWQRLAGMVEGEVQPPQTGAADTPKPPAEAPASTNEPPPKPEDVPVAATENEDATSQDDKLYINFHHQPWGEVLTWFAEEADLSLQLDEPPQGTFNYTDRRGYTPEEAIDLMNRVLLLKGFTLVRSQRLLTLMNLEDAIPPQLVEYVSPDELDERGDFEIVKCLFHLSKLSPTDAEAEIAQLIDERHGAIIAFPKAGQILVTDTAGKLKTIRAMLERVENPSPDQIDGVVQITLNHVGPEEVLAIARPLLGLGEEENQNDTIQIAVDPFSSRMFATGDRDKIVRLQEIVSMVDREPEANGQPLAALEQPQLMTYQIKKADAAQVLAVMQTLLAGLPDVRLAVDEVTKKLVAWARPTEHLTIVETLKQLEGDADQLKVIQLRRVDPQLMILAINKLFGNDGEEGAVDGPRVDGDPTTMKLWVRGSAAEVEQIEELVEKLDGPADGEDALRRNIRIFPLSGGAARSALENVELFWPTMRPNKIRVITPSAQGSTLRERRPATVAPEEEPAQPTPVVPQDPAPQPAPQNESDQRTDRVTKPSHKLAFASLLQEAEQAVEDERPESTDSSEKAPIIISVTPSGLIIASDDLEALDDFETLLRTFTEGSTLLGNEPTIFWLKYVKADAAASILNQVVNGASAGGGGSLLGDVASNVLGDVGGGLLGGVLGIGGDGGSMLSGSASIVPDARLNALIVQASATDLQLIERLLPAIDREASPEEVETNGRPQLIPVIYMEASDMADIVKSVYPDRVTGTQGQQQQQRGPNPEDFIRALRGGGGRGGSRNNDVDIEPAKMTIGVDPRSNSLIVAAPQPLYMEVKMLVEQLDREGLETDDSLDVVTIRNVNASVVQEALSSILGSQMQSSTASTTGGSSSSPSSTASDQQSAAEAARRRIEFFQRAFGGGRPGFGGGRPGFGGGTPGGPSPFGRGGSSPFGSGRGPGGGGPGRGGGR